MTATESSIVIPTANALRLFGGANSTQPFALNVSDTEVTFSYTSDDATSVFPIKFSSQIKASEIEVYADGDFVEGTKYNVHDKLGANTTAISAEETRAIAAEGLNSTNITTETNRAIAAELVHTNDIAAEIVRASAAEVVNANAISDENTRALAAEGANTNAISTEVARATAAELIHTNDIAAEIARATTKENSILSTTAAADTAIETAYQAADTAIETAYQAADDVVRADQTALHIAADNVVRTDFAAADTIIDTAYKAADTAIETAYQAADATATTDRAAIRAEYQAADTAIDTAYKAADAALDAKISFLINSSPETLDQLTEIVSDYKSNGLAYVQRLYRIEEFLEDRYPGTDFNMQETDPTLADGAPNFGYTAPS